MLFFKDNGDYYSVNGLPGYVILKLLRYPEKFFAIWFYALPGYLVAVLMGFIPTLRDSGWGNSRDILAAVMVIILTIISLTEAKKEWDCAVSKGLAVKVVKRTGEAAR
jgi:hypothetical protein